MLTGQKKEKKEKKRLGLQSCCAAKNIYCTSRGTSMPNFAMFWSTARTLPSVTPGVWMVARKFTLTWGSRSTFEDRNRNRGDSAITQREGSTVYLLV